MYGIPDECIKLFKNIYLNSNSCIKTDSGITDFFLIKTEVRESCILQTLLCLCVIDLLMKKSIDAPNNDIDWNEENKLADLDFADDIVLTAEPIH